MDSPAIKTATVSDQAAVFDALTLAFCADPIMRWLYPHPSKFLKYFPELMTHFGAKAFSDSTAHYVDGFAGAALWLRPGVTVDSEPIASLMQRTVEEKLHADLFAVFSQMPEYHPHEPHWYLAAIGIEPARQNQGQGAVLIEHALRTCDRNHESAYLESSNPRNISFYRKHGFEVLATLQSGASPPLTPMYRRAR
jgi:ribosomal protein S18 acetylase RimI-like enzyme